MVLGDLFVLALIVAGIAAAAAAYSRTRQLERLREPRWVSSEWVAEHVTSGSRTLVTVSRKVSTADGTRHSIAERREVGAIDNDDSDYERKLLDLLERASNRAAVLNATPNG